MFETLCSILPKELVVEIVLFEGRVTHAYLQEYVSQVYASAYTHNFGYHHTLTYVTRSTSSLQFYAAWSDVARQESPEIVKVRTPRGFMRPYRGFVPRVRLEKERKRLAMNLRKYFSHKTGYCTDQAR